VLNVVKKHLLEWVTGGTHGRFGSYELAVNALVIPLVLVMMGRKAGGMTVAIAAAAMPLGIVISSAADAFAGERERGTLDLSFMLPISDSGLLFGKILAALAYAAITVAAIWGIGGAYLAISHLSGPPLWAAALSTGAFFVVGFTLALVVAIVSLRGGSAQHVTSISMYIILAFFGVVTLIGNALSKAVAPLLKVDIYGAVAVWEIAFGIALSMLIAALLLFAMRTLASTRFASE